MDCGPLWRDFSTQANFSQHLSHKTTPSPRGWETSTTDVISHNSGGWRIQVKGSASSETHLMGWDGCLLIASSCDGESSHLSYVSSLFIEIQLTYNVVLISAIQKSDSLISVQFSSVTQSCPTLCDPMDSSTPGLPIHHQLPESTQTHVHWVGDAIQPSHPLSSPSPALNLSQHQGLFQWVNSSHQVAKVLEFQL